MPAERPLPDGLVLREGRPDDLEAIVALEVDAFGAQDGPAVRVWTDHLGPETWAVVTDGDRVVAASLRIPQTLVLDGVVLPASQIEYVVTDADHRRQGLVRAQFAHHHRRAAEAGHLATLVGGIPYLYRRFGYGYGLDHPLLFLFDPTALPEPDADLAVRPATVADLDTLLALDADGPGDGLRLVRDRARWAVHLDRAAAGEHSHLLLAERAGRPVGWARYEASPGDGYLALLPHEAPDAATTAAFVRAGLDLAGELSLIAYDRPGHATGDHLRSLGSSLRYDLGIYTRLPDPVAVLDRLRPVLSARLAASAHAGNDQRLDISCYESGVSLHLEGGAVVGVEEGPAVEDPTDHDGVGVAPDWLGALVFGRWGAVGLADRADDVLLGRHRDLMDVLFPALPADVIGDL